jgi:hypothetical protein
MDWDTIGLFTGMMILVSISRRSGMFQYVAVCRQRDRRQPVGARRCAISVHDLHLLRLPDDAGVDRDLRRLHLVALFLRQRRADPRLKPS